MKHFLSLILAMVFVLTVMMYSQLSAVTKAAQLQQTIPLPTPTGLPAPVVPFSVYRVSVASDGTRANADSNEATISADGHHIAFVSDARNLVPGDTNGERDVFVHDRQTGVTTRVSVASDGSQANDGSQRAAISADGRYIAFQSDATNLVPEDTNGKGDIFVHDRETGLTTRVSVSSDGAQAKSLSYGPVISADGRYVAFTSYARNLVPEDTNGIDDIFVHDRQTGATTRVSVASSGKQANSLSYGAAISANGRYVAFTSFASSLVPGDTNDRDDIFVHDRETGITTRVSVASDGSQANAGSHWAAISADGRYIAFVSDAGNLVPGDTNGERDVFVHDSQTGVTTRVSIALGGAQANANSDSVALSADGRYVSFASRATNLVPGDTNRLWDVFVHDCQTGSTMRVSVSSDGAQINGSSGRPAISADGRHVALTTRDPKFVPEGTYVVGSIVVVSEFSLPEVDTTPPLGSITVNGGALYVTDTDPVFSITAADLESGIVQVGISTDGEFYTDYSIFFVPYDFLRETFVPYEFSAETLEGPDLSAENGVKTVYLLLRNSFGYRTVYTGTIILDTSAEQAYGVSINKGSLFTNDAAVILTLPASGRISQIQVSNDGGFLDTPWEPYSLYKPWQISFLGNFLIPRIVYVRYRDVYGNQSAVYQDDINLDLNAPSSEITGLSLTSPHPPTVAIMVQWQGNDSVSGVKWYDIQVRMDLSEWQDWQSQTTQHQAIYDAQPGHTYSFRTRAQDNAGNWETYSNTGQSLFVPGDGSQLYLPSVRR